MKAVTFNPVAITDLDEIISHISQDNPDSAVDVRTAIFDTAQSLGAHPGLGIRPRFSAPSFAGIRFIPANDYPHYLLFSTVSKERAAKSRPEGCCWNIAPSPPSRFSNPVQVVVRPF